MEQNRFGTNGATVTQQSPHTDATTDTTVAGARRPDPVSRLDARGTTAALVAAVRRLGRCEVVLQGGLRKGPRAWGLSQGFRTLLLQQPENEPTESRIRHPTFGHRYRTQTRYILTHSQGSYRSDTHTNPDRKYRAWDGKKPPNHY